MIVKAPEPIPAAPTPAIARPTMKTEEDGATAQMRLPSSKIPIASRKVVLREKYLYDFPHVDWKPPVVMKYAEPYQETSARLWNSSVIRGIAVAMMLYLEPVICLSRV